MKCPLCHAESSLFADVERQSYYRCPSCALTFLQPDQMPDFATQKAVYDLHENDPNDEGYRRFLDRLAGPLTERLSPGDCGLDYGCGPGPALAQMLEERGLPMRVWDPIYANDRSALEHAYDFITCTEVIEHLHRPRDAFEQFRAMLEPGGWLGIMTTWLTDDSSFARWHYRRDPTHVCFWQPDTFHWVADNLGWELELPERNIALLRKRT